MPTSWDTSSCPAPCAILGELQSCLLQFKSDLVRFREIRRKRNGCFSRFLEEARELAEATAGRRQASTSSRTREASSCSAAQPTPDRQLGCRTEDLSGDDTDPDMPDLQPAEPQKWPEAVLTPRTSLGGTPPDSAASPERGGLSKLGGQQMGDFNSCWGRNSLKDALRGLAAQDEETDLSAGH
eukprot:TRINITY_DN19971_c0_g1_i1.p1 TRINITY_DN19971_c0_g1~~TRINITY_DN19971_c0_g1_i1.p1  ORF type:complete len:183 (-),score=25.39 TRINITY_DN19971_c0_g1_i1:44-592(-)